MRRALMTVLLAALAAAAINAARGHDPVRAAREPRDVRRAAVQVARDGLSLRGDFVAASGVLAVQATVSNHGRRPVAIRLGRCGRLTSAVWRVPAQRAGRTWTGSGGALKRFVLRDESPDELYTARLDGRGLPPCRPHGEETRLAPGAVVRERWEMAPGQLGGVSPKGAMVAIAVGETGGRVLEAVEPAAALDPGRPRRPTVGERFDELMADRRLRSWVDAQPASSWRGAHLIDLITGVELTAATSAYSEPLVARSRPDGSGVTVELPSAPARPLAVRAPTLPPGVPVVGHDSLGRPQRDVIAGRIHLPSGRIAVGGDGFFDEEDVLSQRVRPGAYPVRITLVQRRPALATLVTGRRPTVRWRRIGGIGVDGGTGGFTSAEGARAFRRLDDEGLDRWTDRVIAAEEAHDGQATGVLPLGRGTDAVEFTTGLGDGGYPLHAGFDARGRPTRFVLDFGMLHLRWPTGRCAAAPRSPCRSAVRP